MAPELNIGMWGEESEGCSTWGAVGCGLHEQVVLMFWLILKVQGRTSLPKIPGGLAEGWVLGVFIGISSKDQPSSAA